MLIYPAYPKVGNYNKHGTLILCWSYMHVSLSFYGVQIMHHCAARRNYSVD